MRMSDWSSDVCSSDLGRSPGRAGSGGRDQEGEVTEQPQIPFALSLSKRRSSFDLEEGRSFDRLRTNGLGVQPSSFSPLSKSRAPFGSRSNLSIWLASSKLSSARNLSFAAYFIRTLQIGLALCRERMGQYV